MFKLLTRFYFRANDPVCGDDGKTYKNPCMVQCYPGGGIEVECKGKCPCERTKPEPEPLLPPQSFQDQLLGYLNFQDYE